MRVGGDDIHLGVGLGEFAVMLGRVFNFSRAIEGKGCGHENHDRPVFAVRPVFFGHFHEFAIVKSIDFKGLYFGVNQAANESLLGWLKRKSGIKRLFNESIADE